MTPFGVTKSGVSVHQITLSAHGLRATVLTYGAVLNDLRLDGIDHSLTVGSSDLADYEGAFRYHGGIVGPVANRIGNGAAQINGVRHAFDRHQGDTHTLHGGPMGTSARVWQIVETSQNHTTLSLKLIDGEGGFPGNRTITARFEILESPALRLTITTTADAPTLANLTNHSYWNLDGTDHMRDHTLRIAADTYLSTHADGLVTGQQADVPATPLDFRTPTRVPMPNHPFDNTFCVATSRRELTDVAWLRGANGVEMTVATTEPGLHIFDDRPNYNAIAIEAQGWPDAPNQPTFPSIQIAPDRPNQQVTQWRFARH